MKKILLSKEKIGELKKELKKLKKDVLKHHEDEHENIKMSIREAASYDVVIGSKQVKLNELKNTIKCAEILPEKIESERSVLGSWIEVKDEKGDSRNYRLVHPIEANPSKNLLSVESPLGRALIDKKEGDKVVFNDNEVEIIAIM
ncbi:GreA/GreB family elongation factor [Patescibacteria group bacterium]